MPSSGKRKSTEPRSTPLLYGRGVQGKHRFRIRHRHIADHLAPLIASKAVGAAKLDLVLRGVALLPEHAGQRQPGLVLGHYTYEDLHDLARNPDRYGAATDEVEYPSDARRAKRKWTGEQIERLESMRLVHRSGTFGRRELIVLRDDGSGKEIDDPTGRKADLYITVHGYLISTGTLREWNAPELSFYLAAMIGEGFDWRVGERTAPGAGNWYRPLDWFADPMKRRPDGHIRVPFSVPTLERGLRRLRSEGFVDVRSIRRDPRTQRRFSRPRNLYENRFWTLEHQERLPGIRQVFAELGEVKDPLGLLDPELQQASPE